MTITQPAAATSPPSSRLLKPANVADTLGVSERTLERWRQTGEGPRYLSLSRKTVRYRQSDLDAFIEAGGRSNTAERP